MSIWQLEGVSNFGPYVDVDCVDKCSKGELRSWRGGDHKRRATK